MIILPFDGIGREAWDRFCRDASAAWFWHSWRWMSYQEARGARNLSFVVSRGGEILAVCPLILEMGACGASFSVEGHPGPWPAFRDFLPKVYAEEASELIGDHIAGIAEQSSVGCARFRSCPLSRGSPIPKGFSQAQGWQSRVVELRSSEEALHAGLRKSYRSIINKGCRELQFVWAVGGEETGGVIGLCRELHRRAARRRTRPDGTWAMMAEWIRDGHGLAAVASKVGKPIAFAYAILFKGDAYYASGASLEPDVQHAVIWRMILRLRAMGIGRLELGWQGQAAGEKGRNVERFKAGFGGEDAPVAVAERRFA